MFQNRKRNIYFLTVPQKKTTLLTMRYNAFLFIFCAAIFMGCESNEADLQNYDWSSYLGGKGTNQYAPLTQINTENVHQLEIAWTYSSGDADPENRSQIQCNPLVINGVLYGSSPKLKFFALDATNGKELWKFDPYDGQAYNAFGMGVNRGLVHWTDGKEKRLLVTAGSNLYCLDAKTGQLMESFGESGIVDLHKGFGREVDDLFITSNTPGIVYKDLLILGARVSESTGAIPGHIRAFNVKTGEIAWVFHTIPHPGEFGYHTWPEDAWQRSGGANAWSGFSLDEERGIVYVPTGSAAFDFYGGDRVGENLFANTLLALNANTGERIWHYQIVRHDVWDRDLPAPPNLLTVNHNGKEIDAVAQVTKSAFIFLFDRVTGEPLFPIEEVPVPASKLKGEEVWPTQPIPTQPPQFSRGEITQADLTQRTPDSYAFAKSIFDNVDKDKYFAPPSENGAFIFPGLDGGGEWGGGAVDPESATLYINASEMAWVLQMLPFDQNATQSLLAIGEKTYQTNCQICHGKDKQGAAKLTVPSLVNLKDRLDEKAVATVVKNGRAAMPAFGHLSEVQVEALAAFLLEQPDRKIPSDLAKQNSDWPYPYFFNGYKRFNDPDGFPAIKPPWGTLNAINLNTGEIDWKVTLGHLPEANIEGVEATGAESYGGPVVTKGGLIFIGATKDGMFRAFDKQTGKKLWETELPAPGFATPATYMVDGKQYVVIACGGGKLGMPSGDEYVAFALGE